MSQVTESPPTGWKGFVVPDALSAGEPPEERGLERDGVRLLVASPARIEHARFRDLSRFLAAGDLVVVNDSATLPAAVRGRRAGGAGVTVHFSTALSDGDWLVELRRGGGRVHDGRPGECIELPERGFVTLREAWPRGDGAQPRRMWRAAVHVGPDVIGYLYRAGRPITYSHTPREWPLAAYQTIFALQPGSAEMPSAGRPFSHAVIASLMARGVGVATITLHAGVSSLEVGEAPLPERFEVPERTAHAVNQAHRNGRRVIAVGTTATRALESAADVTGSVAPARGWTELVIGPERPARVVDGLVTGWHEPRSSHLSLVEAIAGAQVAAAAYEAAIVHGYLWHEFGDACLLLRSP